MRPEKTWVYIKDFDVATKAVRQIEKYAAQSYINDAGAKEFVKLGFDLEGHRSETNKTRFPRAIWNGKEWDGIMRIWSVGTDPITDGVMYGDRQYLFDVKYLGYPFFHAAFKDMFEERDLLLQNAKFDLMYLHSLGFEPKFITDTLILDWIIGSGDHMMHGLADIYDRTFFRTPDLFCQLSGYDLKSYHARKKKQQNFDWSKNLNYENLQYGADDVRMIFWAESHLWDRIEDYAASEPNDKEGRSIINIVSLEFQLIPIFAKMEAAGLKVDRRKLTEEVIPLVRRMVKEARDQLLTIPEFRRFKPPGVYAELHFKAFTGNALALRAQTIKDKKTGFEKQNTFSNQVKQTIKEKMGLAHEFINVKGDEKAGGDEIFIKIKRKLTSEQKKELLAICRQIMPKTEWDILPTHIINLNSSAQLGPAINAAFKAMGEKIKLPKTPKGSFKTDAETLQTIVDKYGEHRCKPIVFFSHYTEARNFNSKFAQGLLRHLTFRDYIHAHWKQIGADTGRTSASDPPLMQTAANKDLFAYDSTALVNASELVRDLFTAEEGNVFIDLDFSQIEPRFTAQMTGDERMIDMFRNGRDMHQETASIIYSKPYEEITKEERKDGKQTNLATSYDMGYKKLAFKQLFRTKGKTDWTADNFDEAKRIMKAYRRAYAGMDAYKVKIHRKLRRKAEKVGNLAYFNNRRDRFGAREPIAIIQDSFGRIRRWCSSIELEKIPSKKLALDYAPEGEDPNWYYNDAKKRLGAICRQGYNFLVQGGCADIQKYAMLFIDQDLNKAFGEHPKWNPRVHCIRLTLHDEFLVEVPEELAQQALKVIKKAMLRAARMEIKDLPATVSSGIGRTWHRATPDKQETKKKAP